MYLSAQLPILVLYGFHREAIALGEQLLPMIDSLWSQRMTFAVMYHLSLAYVAVLTEEPEHPDKERWLGYAVQTIKRLEVRKRMELCQVTQILAALLIRPTLYCLVLTFRTLRRVA